MTKNKTDKENMISKDANQEEYRKEFGVVDKFLITYQLNAMPNGDKEGFIVFIDYDNDIDWVDNRGDNTWSKDERQARDKYIALLDTKQYLPCKNLEDDDVLTFKKLLATAYALALNKNFDAIDNVIKESTTFLNHRNKEYSRTMFLKIGGIGAIISILFGGVAFYYDIYGWSSGLLMGILGAYVSIWIRYGRKAFTGLASPLLHILETISKLFVGAIFALCAICLVKCNIVFSSIDDSIIDYAYALVGFVAGFSERFIPSMLERFVDNETSK